MVSSLGVPPVWGGGGGAGSGGIGAAVVTPEACAATVKAERHAGQDTALPATGLDVFSFAPHEGQAIVGMIASPG
jgi:hypothetical protein